MSNNSYASVKVSTDRGESLVQQVKVERYRAGQVPKFVSEDTSSSSIKEKTKDGSTSFQEPEKDKRMLRLEKAAEEGRSRRRFEGAVVLNDKKKEEVVVDNNRRRMRELALQKQAQEEEVIEDFTPYETMKSENEESGSEESEEEEEEENVLFRPVFVPKSERVTVQEKEKMEQLEIEAEERKLEQLEDRKKETRELVVRVIKNEIEEARKNVQDPSKVDDTDGLDEKAEYEAWELRELTRIKRDKIEEENRLRELEEVEKLRGMTDEQRDSYLKENGYLEDKKKEKYEFLQRYYHKGAFFMDSNDDIYKRNYNAPTLDDAVQKKSLPEVMQRKKFGKIGQTKWTHLSNEDTSRKDAGWAVKSKVTEKTTKKMAGMKGGFEKPTSKK